MHKKIFSFSSTQFHLCNSMYNKNLFDRTHSKSNKPTTEIQKSYNLENLSLMEHRRVVTRDQGMGKWEILVHVHKLLLIPAYAYYQ